MESKQKTKPKENVYGLTQVTSFREEWKGKYKLLFGIESVFDETTTEPKLVVDSLARLLDAGIPVIDARQLPNHWWHTVTPPLKLKPNTVAIRRTLCVCRLPADQKKSNYLPRVLKDVKSIVGKLHVGAGESNESPA